MIKTMEIDQLIQGCLKKDESAQMEVYNRYHLSMYHSALRIAKNRVDACVTLESLKTNCIAK
jgi:RNA polymerase sigma-70 factor (ECF subfamily)